MNRIRSWFERWTWLLLLATVALNIVSISIDAAEVTAPVMPSVWIKEKGAGAVDGSNRVYVLTRLPDPAGLGVFLDGRYQGQNEDYIILNGTWVIFTVPPPAGAAVRFWYRSLVLAP